MKANIVLINPQIGFSPPFGLLYLGAVLERTGHKVEIIECHTYGKSDFDLDTERLIKKIVAKNPDLIGITCISAYLQIVKGLILSLKRWVENIPIVVGGPHATALPEDMLDVGADMVVLGEGESTLLKIIDYYQGDIKKEDVNGIAYKDSENNVRINPKISYEDVNKIPPPAYHLLNMEHYFARNYAIRGYWLRNGWVFTARGCPGKCIFCASYLTHGYKIRERDIGDIIVELKFLKKKYRIEGFWILDDTFTVKTERVIEFCKRLRESGLNLKWGCQSRVNYFNEKQAVALKKSNCLQVDFGVESGSQRALDYLKKGISVEQSRGAFRICRKYRLRALATVMIGTPYETTEDIEKTRELLNEIRPDYTGLFFTTPYPGTELYKQSIENKWLDFNDDFEWEHIATPKFTTNFTIEELHRIYNSLIKNDFKKTVLDYIAQPTFLLDVIRFAIFSPFNLLKLLILFSRGKREDFINTFRAFRIAGRI